MPSLLRLSFCGTTSQDKHPALDCGDHAAYLDPQRSGLPGLWAQWQVDAREQTDSITHLKHLPQLQGWGWKRWSRAATGLPFVSTAGCGRGRCDTGSRVPRPPRMHLGSNAGRGGCGGGMAGELIRIPRCPAVRAFITAFTKATLLRITASQWWIVKHTLKEAYSWEMWGHWQVALAQLSKVASQADIAQPSFCLSFLYLRSDLHCTLMALQPLWTSPPIFSQVFLIWLIWPWHLSYRT